MRRGLALAGYALAVLAIAFDEHRVGWVAIGLLVGSLVLRLTEPGARACESGSDESEE